MNTLYPRDTLAEQKSLKLASSFNNNESLLVTIIGARTTEPADYTGSYTSALKVVNIEITMYTKAGIATTTVELLLKLIQNCSLCFP